MKRMKRIGLFLIILYSSSITAQQDSGADLYDHRCGLCHRGGGPGTFMLERRLGEAQSILEERNNLTEVYINQVVRWGIGSMPRVCRGEISDPELERITSYLIESSRNN